MDWVTVLNQLVTSHWSSTGKAYLLAWVPPALAKAGVDMNSVLKGRKLKDAIQEDCRAELRVVRNPNFQLVWGAIPIDAAIPTNLADLFLEQETAPEHKAKTSQESMRFGRAIWVAFSKPLKPDHRRYVEVGPPSKMYDIAIGEAPPPLGLEVDEGLILSSAPSLIPMDDRDQQIEENIRKWAAQRGLPLQKLQPAPRTLIGVEKGTTPAEFDFIDFSGLSNADKARILIPLDIIAKLRFGR